MADRLNNLSGYPTMQPNGFPMGSPQQQFIPRHPQQQQGAPGPSQSVPGVDMQRILQWQQMENKYRAQMGGESMNPQVNAQMEFMRNQAAMHAQAHNQAQGQQQGLPQNPPQFSNIAAMNGMNQGQPSQSPALQNQRPVMPQQMSFNNGNQVFPQNPAQLVARNSNPAMLLQNAPNGITPNGISRQLELLGTARNQLPQNGPGPMRIQPTLQSGNTNQAGIQGQNSFQPPSTMFAPTAPNGIRTSPAMQQAAVSAPAGVLTNAQQVQIQQMSRPFLFGPGNVHLPMEETARKVVNLKDELIEKEGRLRTMNPNNAENHPMIKEMMQDIHANKILHQRLMGYLQKAVQQGIVSMQTLQNLGIFRADSQGTTNQSVQQNINNGMPPQQSVNVPQKPPQLVPPPNTQQNWPQAGPSGYGGQQNFNNQQPGPLVQAQGPMSNSPPNMNQFHPPPTLNRHPTPLSQTGPPHQQMMQAIMNRQGGPGHISPQPGQGPSNQMPPAMQQTAPPGGVPSQQQQLVPGNMKRPSSPPPTIPPGMMVPPLEATKFQSGLGTFLQRRSIHLDSRLLSVDNRQIDLYALHTETMRLGGPAAVNSSQDMWEVIAAKLGWNNFPGNGNEPGRSAPHVANHISNVYKEFLAGFEASYIRIYVQGRQGALAQQQQLSRFIQYAHLSVEELRAQGIPDNVIQQIENTRPTLQRLQAARDNAQQQQQQQQQQQMNNGQSVGVSGASSLPQQQPQQPFSQQMLSVPPTLSHNENVPPQPNLSNMVTASPGGPPRQGFQLNPSQIPGSFTQLKQPSPSKPSAEQMQQANLFVQRCKEEYMQNRPHHLSALKQVLDHEKPEFAKNLEELCKACMSVDKLIAAFHAVFNDTVYTTRLIHIIMTANDQRQLLQRGSGRYVFDLTMTRQLHAFVRHAYEAFNQALQMYRSEGLNNQMQSNLPPSGPPPSQQQNMAAQFERQQQPPQSLQVPMRPPTAQQIQPPSNPSLRPQQPGFMSSPHQQPMSQPIKRKVTPMPGADSSPSPAASASTPVASANAATPSHIHSSPQTPKSPKTKAPPKKAPAKRKLSKAKPPAPQAEPASTVSQPSLKRPREEEEISQATPSATTSAPAVDVPPIVKAESPAPVASAATIDRPPSAKRLKAEWSGPPSEDVVRGEDEVESIKTNEDAAKFYDEMSELLKNTDPSGGLSAEVSDALQHILSSMGSSLEHIDPIDPVLPVAGPSEPSAPKSPQASDWVDFFDFSSFTAVDDDAGSKADTPDLVLTSSANPSPESASDTDGHTNGATADMAKIADPTTDDVGEASDPLRLGFWAEIDGGESAYYNSTEWKWDAPMGTSDNNWAFLQS